jgi:hypothetical protein
MRSRAATWPVDAAGGAAARRGYRIPETLVALRTSWAPAAVQLLSRGRRTILHGMKPNEIGSPFNSCYLRAVLRLRAR